MKKCSVFFIILVSVCVIILFLLQLKYRSEKEGLLNNADAVFESCFSQLCDNLNQEETEEANEKNIKYTYVCFSIFNLTSYSENEQMNRVVHILYDLSEKKALYDELDKTSIEALNKLSQYMKSEELLKSAFYAITK